MGRITDFVRRNGIGAFYGRVCEEVYSKLNSERKYKHWIKKYERKTSVETGEDLEKIPFISIVTSGKTAKQSCDNYEVTDKSENAKGNYVAFVWEGDSISQNAVYEVSKKLNEDDYDLLYSDEDLIIDGKRSNPFFKPEKSYDNMESFSYNGGFYVIKKSVLNSAKAVEEKDAANKNSADKTEANNNSTDETKSDKSVFKTAVSLCRKVGHINKILYHRGNKRDVSYEYPTDLKGGFVSIIIPSKDNPKLLENCLDGVTADFVKSGVKFEIIVVDNGSNSENKAKYESILQKYSSTAENLHYIYKPMDFNFSAMCNMGAENARGTTLFFLNDDVTTDEKEGDWAKYMLYMSAKENVGAVGIKLLYPDKTTIQHCGVALFPTGPVHLLQGFKDDKDYAYGRNKRHYSCIAVTAAAMMVEKAKFDEVGGFDKDLSVAYNDVELCIKLYENGYYNINVAESHLIHHESLSRGNDLLDDKKRKRLDEERAILYKKHPKAENTTFDAFYPENYSHRTVDFDLRF